jgi:hypothetical protein
VDVRNDLPRMPAGNHLLPGLPHGQELDVAVPASASVTMEAEPADRLPEAGLESSW